MKQVTGVYADGKVTLDGPADWPEGSRVVVEPAEVDAAWGLTEEEWDDSPEAIEEWIARMDELEPFEITPEEKADIDAWFKKVGDISTTTATGDEIERLFS